MTQFSVSTGPPEIVNGNKILPRPDAESDPIVDDEADIFTRYRPNKGLSAKVQIAGRYFTAVERAARNRGVNRAQIVRQALDEWLLRNGGDS